MKKVRKKKIRKQKSHYVVDWAMWFTSIAFLLLLYCGVHYHFVSLELTGLVGTLGVGTVVAYMANSGYEKKVNAEFGITQPQEITNKQVTNNNGGQTI